MCSPARPTTTVTDGQVLFDGEDILALPPDERAAKGLFLAFQYPLEIPGVATMTFLRTALNAQRKKRGEAELTTPEFIKRVREVAGKLGIDQDMLRRGVNVGFSGGEKKRNEILQMALLEPRLCVLDETDSGLDIDALKVVSEGVNRLRSPERAFVVITHYQRLLDYIVPDVVHVLSKGRIVKTGGKELALELEAKRLRAIPGRGGVRPNERRNPPDQDRGRDRARGELRRGEGARCRAPARCGACASRLSGASRRSGLPHRRVEEWKYTDLRALMRDAKPLAAPPDAAAKARAKDAGATLAVDRGAPHRVRRRRVRAGAVRSRRPRAGPHHPLAGAGAGGGRCARRRRISARSCRPTTSRSRSTPPSWATAR